MLVGVYVDVERGRGTALDVLTVCSKYINIREKH